MGGRRRDKIRLYDCRQLSSVERGPRRLRNESDPRGNMGGVPLQRKASEILAGCKHEDLERMASELQGV